ncbi:MAG: hypothetical protein H0U60_20210, partial [Blastocatellia bacterium]|nr:hypothetical protein [Blastocatellia bacterium]
MSDANTNLAETPTETDVVDRVHAFPAHVLRMRDPETLLRLARAAAPDPAAFEGVDPFFWPAEISSTTLDSYGTHMTRATLKNFAEDLNAGVSF